MGNVLYPDLDETKELSEDEVILEDDFEDYPETYDDDADLDD